MINDDQIWGDSLFPPMTEDESAELKKQCDMFSEYAKQKRNWENAFQRWSNKVSQDGTSPLGCCGYGEICDYCTDNDKGRPCVRALNAMCREKRIEIDYSDMNFERWF